MPLPIVHCPGPGSDAVAVTRKMAGFSSVLALVPGWCGWRHCHSPGSCSRGPVPGWRSPWLDTPRCCRCCCPAPGNSLAILVLSSPSLLSQPRPRPPPPPVSPRGRPRGGVLARTHLRPGRPPPSRRSRRGRVLRVPRLVPPLRPLLRGLAAEVPL